MEYKQALGRAADYCAQQERCISEVRKKMMAWELNEHEIEQALAYLLKEKFIDEQRFAAFYSRDKFRFSGWGRIKIAYHLSAKFVDKSCIAEALQSIDEEAYFERLQDLLIKKKQQIKNKDPWQTKASLVRYAQSRGFEPNLIFKALDQQQYSNE